MITVQFKRWVNGVMEVKNVKSISSDPMDDSRFLIVFSKSIVWEVKMNLIKHIGL